MDFKNSWQNFGKVHSALWLMFKIGLLSGAGILIWGTIITKILYPQSFANEVSPHVSIIAEAVMALACLALSANCLLEGYVSAQGSAKSMRYVISRVLPYIFSAILLGAIAIVLGVLAVQEWLHL